MKKSKTFDLEERLIEFARLVIQISESLNKSPAGRHIAGQILRSGTSSALHYGEAQSAESRNDFIHKLKIVLKELRETLVGLKLTKRVPLSKKVELVEKGIVECNELISIFVKSIETARKNR
ncbi:MAG: four helix bundle protein [Calditrichaeota bacterium]|nr:MAG: four helix bundle protein [Calditrichota bacterium]